MLKSLNHYYWCAFLHNNMTVLKQLMFINQGTHGVLIYLESFLIWLQYNSCPLWKNPVDLKTWKHFIHECTIEKTDRRKHDVFHVNIIFLRYQTTLGHQQWHGKQCMCMSYLKISSQNRNTVFKHTQCTSVEGEFLVLYALLCNLIFTTQDILNNQIIMTNNGYSAPSHLTNKITKFLRPSKFEKPGLHCCYNLIPRVSLCPPPSPPPEREGSRERDLGNEVAVVIDDLLNNILWIFTGHSAIVTTLLLLRVQTSSAMTVSFSITLQSLLQSKISGSSVNTECFLYSDARTLYKTLLNT